MSSKLKEELQDKEYRHAYVAATVRNGIAFQIRAMRESREWDQKKLASKMGNEKLQPIISRYENPDYGRFSVSTLLDLADAFDVGLVVEFVPFSEMVQRDDDFINKSLDVDGYAKDLLAPSQSLQPIAMNSHYGDLIEPIDIFGLLNNDSLFVVGTAKPVQQSSIMELLSMNQVEDFYLKQRQPDSWQEGNIYGFIEQEKHPAVPFQ